MTQAGFPLDSDGIWIGPDPAAGAAPRPALFLDRDGVLVEDVPYLHQPAEVKLMAGAAALLQAAAAVGWWRVLVTNQSGIGRGFYGWKAFAATQQEIDRQLAAEGAALDLVVACPYHAEAQGSFRVADHPDRKPNPGMLLKAARRLPISLERSAIVGDRASDLEAGKRAGLAAGLLLGQTDTAATMLPGGGYRVLRVTRLAQVAAALGLASS